MYKLVLFVLNSVLVSAAIRVYDQPVATSYTFRSDGQEGGYQYGSGYMKKYGFAKVVVTTYYVPKLVPAATYSTYIIHPVDGKQLEYNGPDSVRAGTVQQPETKGEDDSSTTNDANKGANALDAKQVNYENMIEKESRKFYKEWDKAEIDDLNGYWEKLRKQFDNYYDNKYNQFVKDNSGDELDYSEGYQVMQNAPQTPVYENDFDEDYSDASETKYGYQFDRDPDFGFGLHDQYWQKW